MQSNKTLIEAPTNKKATQLVHGSTVRKKNTTIDTYDHFNIPMADTMTQED